jgi:hypothetical protein
VAKPVRGGVYICPGFFWIFLPAMTGMEYADDYMALSSGLNSRNSQEIAAEGPDIYRFEEEK